MLYIYSSSENTQRLDYVARHLFNAILGVDFTIVRDKETFLQQREPCINYSNENLNHGLCINPHGLLNEKGVRQIQDIEVSQWNGYCCFFRQSQGDIPFDLFAASFYLLTFYEEYFPKRLDKHERFDPEESLAYRNGFLEIPVIDRWAYLLKDELMKKYPAMAFNLRKFRFVSTYDIDYPYWYLKKGWIKMIVELARDLWAVRHKDYLPDRWYIFIGEFGDPYLDATRLIERIHKENDKPYFLFVLMKKWGKYGTKTIYPLTSYYRLLKSFNMATIGLHPSYNTCYKPLLIMKEKKRLEKVLEKKEITASRQHFLRMQVPETFRNLEKAGIRDDFTTAFAQAPGFRTGTAVPHYFYDVEKDHVGDLLLHPTVVMDTALITHLKLTPDEAFEKIKRLVNECKQSGGDFLSLWHNSNLSLNVDDNPWLEMYLNAFHYANSIENDTFVPKYFE